MPPEFIENKPVITSLLQILAVGGRFTRLSAAAGRCISDTMKLNNTLLRYCRCNTVTFITVQYCCQLLLHTRPINL